MKAEIKNIKITLGDKEYEFTMEELKALKKAIDDFLPQETIKDNNDLWKRIQKDTNNTPVIPRKYPDPIWPMVPITPTYPDKLPWEPYKIWCEVKYKN